MKKFLLFVGFILFINFVSAESLTYLNVSVSVEDSLAKFHVIVRFPEDVKEVPFLLNGEVKNIKTVGGTCSVEKRPFKVLVCKPPSPFMIGETVLFVDFDVEGLVRKEGNISVFSFDLPMGYDVKEARIKVLLPVGMFVSNKVPVPVSPSGSKSFVEGRRVGEEWMFRDLKKGDIIALRVYYEPATPVESFLMAVRNLRFMLLIVAVISVLLSLLLVKKFRKKGVVLSVLTPEERSVVEVILKNNGVVEQKKIVLATGMSKAKVSRIISSLKIRGLVEVERIGRKNKVKLVKRIVEHE